MPSLRDEIGEFVGIPNSFIEDDKQTAESRVVFMILRYHTHRKKKRAFPGFETIMREAGLSRQKASAGIKTLVETGWLVKHKLFAQNTEYELRYPTAAYSSTEELREDVAIVPPANDVSSTEEQPPYICNKTDLTKTEEKITKEQLSSCAAKPPKRKASKLPPYPPKREWPDYVHVYVAVTEDKPMRAVWPKIRERLGDTPDLEFAQKCFAEWLDRGYNARNNAWLDWYASGTIPPNPFGHDGGGGEAGNGHQPAGPKLGPDGTPNRPFNVEDVIGDYPHLHPDDVRAHFAGNLAIADCRPTGLPVPVIKSMPSGPELIANFKAKLKAEREAAEPATETETA